MFLVTNENMGLCLRNTVVNSLRIKKLSLDIRSYFVNQKITRVRNAAVGGNVNLWKAVKIAKNINSDAIPSNLTVGGLPIAAGQAANSFALYFSKKVNENVQKTNVDINNVYNGKCKLIVQSRNFMTMSDVKECLADLNTKKCEGFDRIPVCSLNIYI